MKYESKAFDDLEAKLKILFIDQLNTICGKYMKDNC